MAMREELIADQGGVDNLSVAKLALIEMIARDVYFPDECARRARRSTRSKKQDPRAEEKIKVTAKDSSAGRIRKRRWRMPPNRVDPYRKISQQGDR
jgi:hypothetical protein